MPSFIYAERQFLVEYFNPFDKRGIERIQGIGSTDEEIVQLKVHYKNLGDGLGEVVNEQRAYDTLLSILKRIDIDRKTHVSNKREIGLIIDGETVPVLVLGDQDPLTIDPTQPNEAQLLHHGAKRTSSGGY